MQENPIAVSEILSVWEVFRPMEDPGRFVFMIGELDNVFLSHVNKERERRTQANKRKAGAKMLRK